MNYLKYHKNTKQVTEISSKPLVNEEGYAILRTDRFSEGAEFEFSITVNSHYTQENENDTEIYEVLGGFTAIRNNPQAQALIRDNKLLKEQNHLLKIQNETLSSKAEFTDSVIQEIILMMYMK